MMISQSFSKQISKRHQKVSMPDHVERASDEFAIATQSFANWKGIT